jgi:hypothetical protein
MQMLSAARGRDARRTIGDFRPDPGTHRLDADSLLMTQDVALMVAPAWCS